MKIETEKGRESEMGTEKTAQPEKGIATGLYMRLGVWVTPLPRAKCSHPCCYHFLTSILPSSRASLPGLLHLPLRSLLPTVTFVRYSSAATVIIEDLTLQLPVSYSGFTIRVSLGHSGRLFYAGWAHDLSYALTGESGRRRAKRLTSVWRTSSWTR